MPLIIPIPAGSMVPFLTQAKSYLLNITTYTDHSDNLHAFAESINPDTISIDAFFQGLSQAEQLDTANKTPSKSRILDGLRRYLTQTSKNGSNVLMIAMRYYPEEIASIIAAMTYLDSKQQAVIISQVTSNGWNVLMYATRYHAAEVIPILGIIARLHPKQQAAIFIQTIKGWNTLSFAVRYHPETLAPILEAMTRLNLKALGTVFKQTDAGGWNVLMTAIRYAPDTVDSILKAMTCLSLDDQVKIYMHTTPRGWNSLTLATRYNPGLIPLLRAAIIRLSPKDQTAILHQTDIAVWKTLKNAIHYHPSEVTSILMGIAQLDYNDQVAIFQRITHDDWRILIDSACKRYHPDAMHSLLSIESIALKFELFHCENSQWFPNSSPIIQNLFATNHVQTILNLLQNNRLWMNDKAFWEVVSRKQELLDYILSLEEDTRYELLKDALDHKKNSPLASVFHASKGFLKPQSDRGVLGQAEAEYKRLQKIFPNDIPKPEPKLAVWTPLRGKKPIRQTTVPTFEDRLNRIGFKGEIPSRFQCQINLSLMNNPVLLSDGHHYDEAWIKTYIKQNPGRLKSPLNYEIVPARYTVDYDLKSEIDEFVLAQERDYEDQTAASSSQDPIEIQGLYPFLLPLTTAPIPYLAESPVATTSNESSPVFYDQTLLAPLLFFTPHEENRLKQLESLPEVPATALESMPVREIIEEASWTLS